jgi:NADH dehydrogenase
MADRICIIGGSGFVGSALAKALVERGYAVRVPTRKITSSHPLNTTEAVDLCEADVHDSNSLHTLFKDCRAVINLVGILNESRRPYCNFDDAHVELTKKIIRACEDTNIGRLLHMSALHANAERGPSNYLRTKGIAQDLVAAANRNGLATSWFCPSVIFGPGDSFFNRFAALLKIAPLFPLACPDSRFAPVYVGDVVNAFVYALEHDECIGTGYPLCGPQEYSLKELVEYTATTCGMKRYIVGLNQPLSALQARLLGLLPGKPMSYDNYLSLTVDSTCEQPYPEIFGKATAINDIVPLYLR